MEREYKWDTPAEWLEEKARKLSACGDDGEVMTILITLLGMVDSDQIQETFQNEMDCDGYFDPIGTNPVDVLIREQLIAGLESIGVACYDDESTEDLREAFQDSVESGDLDGEDWRDWEG